jgi:hypothetical protein
MSKPVGFSNSRRRALGAQHAIANLGHFQHRGHRHLDTFQLAALLQLLHEIAKIANFINHTTVK